MSESEDFKKFKEDIDNLHSSLDLRVGSYLNSLKVESTEAVQSGSVKDALEILEKIQPIEDGRQMLSDCYKEFLKIFNDEN